MGLLDDAIREHLELKRRRGADPGEVARQERAALDPGFADVQQEPLGDDLTLEGEAPEQATATAEAERHAPAEQWPATPAQETAEIDMQAVLESDLHEGHQGDPLEHEAMPAHDARGEEEPIEWETPGRPEGAVPEQIPGQERLTFE